MKNPDPLVSVIIPTHNRAKMVQRAINSVLGQTWQGEIEIMVVSDGSTDNTAKVIKSIDDSRIKFFKHSFLRGASAARNTAMRAAKGKYIAFLDDDDEWTSNKLEVQMPVIEHSAPEVGLVYAWMEYSRDGKFDHVNKPELRGNVFAEMLDKQAIGGCPTIIIKREVIDKIGYFDESLLRGNDGDYWRRISKHYHVDYVPEVLARIYIGHDDRISCTNKKMLSAEIFNYQKRLEVFRDEFNKYPEKKMSILIKIGIDYLLIWKPIKSIPYFVKALMCSCKFATKVALFFEGGKIGYRRLHNQLAGYKK